ncbi:hypothetical protein [Mucilaginibacter sp. SG564]|uniref:WD40/YVTN/BNR-like repeat-containing protein n=1 Tax=unclassified Mucilaginibacter TaxID=2617802 RepID=UPI001C12A9B7|nr:hypothetical protein [Mucilaginibacter sp. SG564]NOW97908.1 photosystem II stability/assembly factor-like uncharacterized protein [Mucilaginibacter sp. SG564]
MKTHFFLLCIIVINFNITVNAQKSGHPYNWKSVQIRGGGFVDGIIYHPTTKNLLYCRTDMGGAYKWNEAIKAWEPLLDWVSYRDRNLMGVESIALDAHDPNRVYMACGTYTSIRVPNAILRSDDRGKTFKRTDVPFRMGGNENGRGNGERMAVDPNNGNIIYMGTRLDGLWKSGDAGITWNRVNNFPEIRSSVSDTMMKSKATYHPSPNGIIFVLFDPKSRAGTRSNVIYVGVSQKGVKNLFRSTDGGASWAAVPGEPTDLMPTHAALSADGVLYITYGSNPGPDMMTDGAVYKYTADVDQWTNITPVKPRPENQLGFGYAAVAVDPQNPQIIIVSTFHRYGKAGGDDIFRTLNAGSTWKPVFTGSNRGKFDYRDAPYVSRTGIHWLFDIEIDPFDSAHALFTTGYGIHETFDLTDVDKGKPSMWGTKNKGIEETVALELLSPPKGALLISAIGDYGGFVHHDLDEPAPDGNFINPHFANTDGVACAAKNSDIVVRIGEGTKVGDGNIGYSMDGGKIWQPTTAEPQTDSKHGFICVSALGNSWIWTPRRSASYITNDKGTSWKQIQGLPNNTRVIADPLNDAKFYAMDLFNGKLYTSTDNGHSFTQQDFNWPNALPDRTSNRGDIRGGQDRLYAAPGSEGDLWVANFDGLYHSNNGSAEFRRVGGVTEIHGFGFGKASPKSTYPALYLAGIVNGTDGIFRSDDKGETWVRVNDEKHRWGLILQISGDPSRYGRVYVGTHGRGIFYGDIITSN